MPTRSVILTEHFDQFIEAGIDSGRFSDANEVMREGLRLLEEREQEERVKLEWLRAAVKEGFDAYDRGDFIELDSGGELASFMESIHDEVAAEVTHANKGVDQSLRHVYLRCVAGILRGGRYAAARGAGRVRRALRIDPAILLREQ